MNKQTHHLVENARSYERRKVRSNVTIKSNMPEYRAIANKSNMYNELTVVDDHGKVIAQKIDKGIKGSKVKRAFELGKLVAELLKDKKVTKVVFDRNGFRYTGRIAQLCEGLREGGVTV